METTYNPNTIEKSWYQHWENKGYFAPQGNGVPYTIMIPPPNVTGSLHMGHAFQQSVMDALIRYHRMKGNKTLWQAGMDHAGIATQMVVERKLVEKEGKTRYDLGREEFTKKVWSWKEESGGMITQQMRRLGNSVNWAEERFTMDEGFTKAVKTAFVKLYEDGLAYRGKRLVNWDPQLQTAISDLEVENKDKKGHLWYFRYPLAEDAKTAEGKDYLVVATTRPETMLGDSAVAVHPEDKRYQSIIGKKIQLPLTGRKIPVVADDYVDKTFGTGCVKITPAHDFNDYELGKRHQLPLISIMTKQGAIANVAQVSHFDGSSNNNIDTTLPVAFCGLDRFAARKVIIEEFDKQGLLEKTADHTLKVPYGDRSGVVIEPLLTDQWFIKAKVLAEPNVQAVEDGKITFVPKQYENMYFAWMRNIQDWCISRQLWWGHRIPAWYDEAGNVYVAKSEEALRKKYHLDDSVTLTQDNDVFDTWFSSALWTFASLGWPDDTEQLKTFHPTDVLVTGFDIIFFWVARMMMMSMYFVRDENGEPQVPFKKVYMHGLIRDEQGQKMSKSKGNVLDPLDMIDGIDLESLVNKRCGNMMQPQMAEKIAKRTRKQFPKGIAPHGADALRYTLYSLASTGRDINWDMNRLEGYRNFCNKLWNASRYVLMNTEGHDCSKNSGNIANIVNQWVLQRLKRTIEKTHKAIENFRLDHASQALYEFVWNDYCDWYLELSKPILRDEDTDSADLQYTRFTLVFVLDNILKLLHPMMPFITEEIWQKVKVLTGNTADSLMTQPYPEVNDIQFVCTAERAEKDISWLQGIICAVRNIRRDMNIAPGKPLELLLKNATNEDRLRLANSKILLHKLGKISTIDCVDEQDNLPLCTTQLVGTLEVMVPMADFIDKHAEITRLNKELAKINGEIKRLSGKLSNDKFRARAPSEVVAKEQRKFDDAISAKEQLSAQLTNVSQM